MIKPIYSILFVCAANVGRSQIAEGFYNHYAKDKKAISAAGIQDVREKYNYKPDPHIIRVMSEKGIDISKNFIKIVNESMVEQSGSIILFCDPLSCPSYLRDNPKVKHISVEDPYMPGDLDEVKLERFRKTRDKIEEIVLTLV